MADVFISYKRRLRPAVEHLAAALRDLDVSVWFDARLEPGDSFSDEIAREVRQAKCVLVCWSNDAFPHGGDTHAWVRGEATLGLERRVLVSVQVEPTDFDPPWNMMHNENLVGWLTPDGLGARDDPRWLSVLQAIGRHTGKAGLCEPVANAEAKAAAGSTASVRPMRVGGGRGRLWLAAGAIAAVIGAGAVGLWAMGGVGDAPPADFRARAIELCQALPGNTATYCGCSADFFQKELSNREQAIYLVVMRFASDSSGGAPITQADLDAVGVGKAEVDAFIDKIGPLSDRAETQCRPAAAKP